MICTLTQQSSVQESAGECRRVHTGTIECAHSVGACKSALFFETRSEPSLAKALDTGARQRPRFFSLCRGLVMTRPKVQLSHEPGTRQVFDVATGEYVTVHPGGFENADPSIAHRVGYIENDGPLWCRPEFLPGGTLPEHIEWGPMPGDDDPDEGETMSLGEFLWALAEEMNG